MSTRSNTIVKNMKTDEKVYLYRHCDGYLEGAGFDVLDALNKFVTLGKENTIQNIAEFIKEKCDGTYEDTDSIHGDIDYLYVIEVDGEDVTLMGDGNLRGVERCSRDRIAGTAVEILRNGEKRVDCRSPRALRQARIWRRLMPLRRIILGFYRRLFL